MTTANITDKGFAACSAGTMKLILNVTGDGFKNENNCNLSHIFTF
jgi:hypothetical protein